MNKKKAAFIFALPIRTNPILITMPFGLNVIQILDKKGYKIDVFLSEYSNNSYKDIFSKNVKIHFINQNYLWRNKVSLAFFMVTKYFKLISFFKLRNKYDLIFGTGSAGITLGAILKKLNKQSKFIYLNDEFPLLGNKTIWVENEIKNALHADFVSTPDEVRFTPLCQQIPGLNKIKHFTLPNSPLIGELENIPKIDWHSRLNINKSKKIFLMAGGMYEIYQLPELLVSVEKWPNDTVLLLKGKSDLLNIKRSFSHLNLKDKVIWNDDFLTPNELHSLIKYCSASICLYRDINDNFKFVGKSSGKLMRSIALGNPVIASKSDSLNFVENLGIGKLVYHPNEIPKAVQYVIDNDKSLKESCLKNYAQISYEEYWDKFEKHLI